MIEDNFLGTHGDELGPLAVASLQSREYWWGNMLLST